MHSFTQLITLTSALAATLLALPSATARNPPNAMPQVASKRSIDERVFLANCIGTGNAVNRASEMNYYSTDAKSRTGAQPDAIAGITTGSYVTWEGQSVSGTFPDGNKFVSNIDAGAQNLANFAYAGSGYNHFTHFNCYKDNMRALWGWGVGVASFGCYSAYYCEDA